jgi:DNA replication protein DnaC
LFGNPESQLCIEEIVSGVQPFPAFGKSGILLYGVPGTGKTTLAGLLPEAIEYAKTQGTLISPLSLLVVLKGQKAIIKQWPHSTER